MIGRRRRRRETARAVAAALGWCALAGVFAGLGGGEGWNWVMGLAGGSRAR